MQSAGVARVASEEGSRTRATTTTRTEDDDEHEHDGG
jgi:hypothetical protein